jgi:hypothetical protein
MFYSPPKVPPLEYNGISLQQDREIPFEGREMAATYLSALDIKTGDLLWCIKICDPLRYTSPKEIATVDFSKLTLGPGENELTIETIVDSRYLVDLQTHTVTLLPTLESVKKHRKIPQADPSDPPMPPPWPRRQKR